MNRLRLSEVYRVKCGEALCQEHVTPVYAWVIGDKLQITHLVVVGIDVAQLHRAIACLCQTSLDSHHSIGLFLCRSLVVAHEFEQCGEQFLVCLAHLHGLFVVVEIVVALVKAESTLSHSYDIH